MKSKIHEFNNRKIISMSKKHLILAAISLFSSASLFAGDPVKTHGNNHTTVITGMPLVLPSGNYWQVGGNSVNLGDWLGTLNNQPLIFKVNGVQQLTILQAGSVVSGNTNFVGSTTTNNFVFGQNNILTTANSSVMMGSNNNMNGSNSFSFGTYNFVQGAYSVAIGGNAVNSGLNKNLINGDNSIVIGYWNSVNINTSSSFSFGYHNQIGNNVNTYKNSMGIGFTNTINASGSITLGSGNTISADNSVALGSGNIISAANAISIGQGGFTNNISNSIMLGTTSAPSIFVDSYGLVGIGTTTPKSQLDVVGADATGVVSHFENGGGTACAQNDVFIAAGLANSGDYNTLTQPCDNGIFWRDNGGGNKSSGFVLAPHNGIGGLRIDGLSGNIAIKTNYGTGATWTNSHWDPFISTNASGVAMVTGLTGTTNVYLGTGTTDDGSSTGWYWILSSDALNNSNDQPTYPMSLTYQDAGFNATSSEVLLDVKGVVRSHEVRVCLSGCDFVFEKGYSLMGLKELDNYIQQNHHLPGIASAKEMESDNVSLGKLDSQLLQKVEELTLYTIKLQKQVDDMQALKDEVAELKAQLAKQNNR